ncbi:MAG: hypothetical protein ACHQT8_03710 [Chlamydiales bacterium]
MTAVNGASNNFSLTTLVKDDGSVALNISTLSRAESLPAELTFAPLRFLEVEDLVNVERVNHRLSASVREFLYFPDSATTLESGKTTNFLSKTFLVARRNAACARKEQIMCVGNVQFKNRILHLIYSDTTDYHFPQNVENFGELEKTLQNPQKTLQKTWRIVSTLFKEVFAFPHCLVLTIRLPFLISGADFNTYFRGKFCKLDDRILKILVAKEMGQGILVVQAEKLSSCTPSEKNRAFHLTSLPDIIDGAKNKAAQNLQQMTILDFEPGPEAGITNLQYIPSPESEFDAPLVKALEPVLLKNAFETAGKNFQDQSDKKDEGKKA